MYWLLETELKFLPIYFQIAETGKRLKLLLHENVKPVVAQIAECLADWYKRAQTIYLKVRILFTIICI